MIGSDERAPRMERPHAILSSTVRVSKWPEGVPLWRVGSKAVAPFLVLLVTFLLCEGGVLQKPVLYLSHYFKQRRQEYYDRLQAVRDSGDWEGWLAFFLRGVAEVSAQAADTARRTLALREEHRAAVTAHLGRAAGNGHRVLEKLYEQPIMSVPQIRQLTGTT